MGNLPAHLHRPNPALDAGFRPRSSASGFRRFQEYSTREYALESSGQESGVCKSHYRLFSATLTERFNKIEKLLLSANIVASAVIDGVPPGAVDGSEAVERREPRFRSLRGAIG
jgi:hypothetical protein